MTRTPSPELVKDAEAKGHSLEWSKGKQCWHCSRCSASPANASAWATCQ